MLFPNKSPISPPAMTPTNIKIRSKGVVFFKVTPSDILSNQPYHILTYFTITNAQRILARAFYSLAFNPRPFKAQAVTKKVIQIQDQWKLLKNRPGVRSDKSGQTKNKAHRTEIYAL